MVDRELGSGDRVRGFKSQPWQSGFSVSFFFLFLLIHFLLHGFIQTVVCPLWFLFEVQHYSGTIPAMEKSYRDQLVTARGDLYGKILAAPTVGKNMDKWVMFGANKNSFFLYKWPTFLQPSWTVCGPQRQFLIWYLLRSRFFSRQISCSRKLHQMVLEAVYCSLM